MDVQALQALKTAFTEPSAQDDLILALYVLPRLLIWPALMGSEEVRFRLIFSSRRTIVLPSGFTQTFKEFLWSIAIPKKPLLPFGCLY